MDQNRPPKKVGVNRNFQLSQLIEPHGLWDAYFNIIWLHYFCYYSFRLVCSKHNLTFATFLQVKE